MTEPLVTIGDFDVPGKPTLQELMKQEDVPVFSVNDDGLVRLDLGAGEVPVPGFISLGNIHGTSIYPLDYPDNSVDVIRASHVLEHFSHRDVEAVLKDWVRALKPGGILKIAVPDFELMSKAYLAGARTSEWPWDWAFMGAQEEPDGFHKSIFDREHLRARLAYAGLVLLKPWESEIVDCANYPISLNIQGTKPAQSELLVSACMSVPRLGFMDNFFCAIDGILPLNIRLRRQGGAFWGQALTTCIEKTIEQDHPDALLFIDYDSVFSKHNVAMLTQLMMAHPEADAIVALQSSRHMPTALFSKKDEATGAHMPRINTQELEPDLMKIHTAHFGLTLIRTKCLETIERPWFIHVPDEKGSWSFGEKPGEGKIDEDINFWKKWGEAGHSLYLANRVVVGHAELMIRWPNERLEAQFQPMREWNDKGAPEWVWK